MNPENKQLVIEAVELFVQHYGVKPEVAVFAPGRVNLIGEHTDYNDGWVLPFAIPFITVIVGTRTKDNVSRVSSTYCKTVEPVEFKVDKHLGKGVPTWCNYVKGAIAQYVDDLPPGFAFNACIASNVPDGSGLSSSAALEVSVSTFVETLVGGIPSINGVQKALRCQRAEHTFADTPCGIMDQFISTMGKAGHLLLIDCRSQNYELVPFGSGPNSPVIIVTNSLVKHKLSGSEYPDRVKSCKEAVRVIQSIHPKVIALRDVTMQMLDEVHRSLAGVRGMSEQTYKRAKHSITEDFRTLDTIEALKSGDFKRVGINMTASHISLRDDFEVSCIELDRLVEIANSVPGVYGSRMTGGGFGGCTVTLVERSAVGLLVSTLQNQTHKAGHECLVYPPMSPSAGCGVLNLDEILDDMGKNPAQQIGHKTLSIDDAPEDAQSRSSQMWVLPLLAIAAAGMVAFSIMKKK